MAEVYQRGQCVFRKRDMLQMTIVVADHSRALCSFLMDGKEQRESYSLDEITLDFNFDI